MIGGTCHFCGGDTPCECTDKCRICGHIGHEHYGDGRCRGTNYDGYVLIEESCPPHMFETRSVRPRR